MKISRHTKEKLATVKEESMQVKRQLETMHIRLSEHPGTKRIANKLERVINQLEPRQSLCRNVFKCFSRKFVVIQLN